MMLRVRVFYYYQNTASMELINNGYQGYTLFLWTLLEWDMGEYQIFLMELRKALRKQSLHGYMAVRYIWGQKPKAT